MFPRDPSDHFLPKSFASTEKRKHKKMEINNENMQLVRQILSVNQVTETRIKIVHKKESLKHTNFPIFSQFKRETAVE